MNGAESVGKVDMSCVSAELAKLRSTLRWQHASAALDRLREMGGETGAAEPPAEPPAEPSTTAETVEDWGASFSQAVSSMQCVPLLPLHHHPPSCCTQPRCDPRFRPHAPACVGRGMTVHVNKTDCWGAQGRWSADKFSSALQRRSRALKPDTWGPCSMRSVLGAQRRVETCG
jgi:hypothetical protein